MVVSNRFLSVDIRRVIIVVLTKTELKLCAVAQAHYEGYNSNWKIL